MLVIWAIDPIREPGNLLRRSAEFLEDWCSRLSLQIEPLFVFTPSQLDLNLIPGAKSSVDPEERHRTAALRALNQIVNQQSIDKPNLKRSLLTPQVLMEHRPWIRAAVERLEDYAQLNKASFVVLPTHGRKGLSRLVLGSFAETLLLRAQVPTLTLGPEIIQNTETKKILFATDFDSGSKAHFRKVVELSVQLKSKLLLYHAVPNLIAPIFQSGAYLFAGAWIPARNYFQEEIQERFRRGNAWARWASHQGAECTFVLDELGGSVPNRILELIRTEQICLTALASRSGPVSATLLGSITRQVVRTAPCPVWIIQPETPISLEKPRALAG